MTPRWRAADAGQPTLTASKPPRSQLQSTRARRSRARASSCTARSSGSPRPSCRPGRGRTDVPVGDPERMTAPGEAERVARLRPAGLAGVDDRLAPEPPLDTLEPNPGSSASARAVEPVERAPASSAPAAGRRSVGRRPSPESAEPAGRPRTCRRPVPLVAAVVGADSDPGRRRARIVGVIEGSAPHCDGATPQSSPEPRLAAANANSMGVVPTRSQSIVSLKRETSIPRIRSAAAGFAPRARTTHPNSPTTWFGFGIGQNGHAGRRYTGPAIARFGGRRTR